MDEQEHQALWDAVRDAGANWRPGHNAITELAPEDRRRRLGYVPSDSELSLEDRERTAPQRIAALAVGAVAAPSHVDWRSQNGNNYISSIKDQGSCGSCVSFGTIATLEGRVRVINNTPMTAPTGGSLPDLSEAQLFYCGNIDPDPCKNGWWVTPALKYATNTGIVPASCFPYRPGNQPCALCQGWQNLITQVGTTKTLTSAPDMKSSLATSGPLITCFTVYSDFYAYTGGVYQRTPNAAPEGGHCVCCIGFDDAKVAWLCKNSWGTGWGEGGFFWIAYGQCGIDAMMWGIDTIAHSYVLPTQRRRAVQH